MILIPEKIEIQTKNIKKTSFVLYMKCLKYTLKIMQHNMMNSYVPSTQLMQILTLCHIYFRFSFLLFYFCVWNSVCPPSSYFSASILYLSRYLLFRESLLQGHIATVFIATLFIKGKNYKQYKVLLICILRNILATPYIMEIKNE